jgi:hypothetical protein
MCAGQAEAEAGAAAGLRIHPHVAAMFQNGLAGEGQPQANAAGDLPGPFAWLYPRRLQDFGRHSSFEPKTVEVLHSCLEC